MKVTILDYGAGNIQSVQFALARLGIDALLSNDKELILTSDKIIFPGVGHATQAMKQLNAAGLTDLIPELKQDVLGICLGMQLLCKHSEEGDTMGLGVFDAEIKRFSNSVKVPHMGWNDVDKLSGALFKAIPNQSDLYFVHSYYAELNDFAIASSSFKSNM